MAETTTTLPPAPDYEKEFETAGLFVTVHDSILSPTLSYMRAGDVPAPDGGVYLYVTTTVRNESDQAIDLTCSLPLWTHAIDEKGRKYDAVEKLYDIKGNPECNASLNPGFSSDVTWVFLVPTTATMTGFRFVNSESIGSNLPELTVRIAPTA